MTKEDRKTIEIRKIATDINTKETTEGYAIIETLIDIRNILEEINHKII